jgi:hypothetical protein
MKVIRINRNDFESIYDLLTDYLYSKSTADMCIYNALNFIKFKDILSKPFEDCIMGEGYRLIHYSIPALNAFRSFYLSPVEKKIFYEGVLPLRYLNEIKYVDYMSFDKEDIEMLCKKYDLRRIEKKVESFEPKKYNNFIVEFPIEFNIESTMIQKVSEIKFEDDWKNIEIVFCDIIEKSVIQGLLNIIKHIKTKVIKPLFNLEIKLLNDKGIIIESWNIAVNKVISIDLGGFDYNNLNIRQPKIIIKPLDLFKQISIH